MRTCVRGCVSGAICFRSGFGFVAHSQRLWWVPPSRFRGRRAAHPSDHSSAALRGDVLGQSILLRLGRDGSGIRDGGLELREPVSCALLRRLDQSLVLRRARRQRARERMRGCKQSQGYAKPRHLHSLLLCCTPTRLAQQRGVHPVPSQPLISAPRSLAVRAEPRLRRTARRILSSRPLVRPADASLDRCIRPGRRMEAYSPHQSPHGPFCDLPGARSLPK